MAFGPIISTGGKPWLEALLVVAIIALVCVMMSPGLTVMTLRKMPWLAPVFHLLKHLLNSN